MFVSTAGAPASLAETGPEPQKRPVSNPGKSGTRSLAEIPRRHALALEAAVPASDKTGARGARARNCALNSAHWFGELLKVWASAPHCPSSEPSSRAAPTCVFYSRRWSLPNHGSSVSCCQTQKSRSVVSVRGQSPRPTAGVLCKHVLCKHRLGI